MSGCTTPVLCIQHDSPNISIIYGRNHVRFVLRTERGSLFDRETVEQRIIDFAPQSWSLRHSLFDISRSVAALEQRRGDDGRDATEEVREVQRRQADEEPDGRGT